MMAAPEDTRTEEARTETAVYVYGIVPADVEAEPDATGVGDPPSGVDTVRHEDIAALVSEVRIDRPLGRPEDLEAHAHLLDGAAAVVPVLPLKFGAVVTDTDAVTDELLAPHHDEFRTALDQVEGKAQYVVKGRYDESAVLQEILSENEDAARLRDEIREVSEDAGRDARIALGELVSNAVTAKRDADTATVVEAVRSVTDDVRVRPPTHDLDAVHLAVLIKLDAEEDLGSALSPVADDWSERVELRVVGPMAAYDFVAAPAPDEAEA
ncbi:GvpL/GvpF family gas vesicle protein [Rhodococcus sp. NPDC003318]|uniref:GvpL/GvpF family gas vesicle protein n=1 Tax=Rhodococcus sp. NPDC003318 TaxID=3364503 RepID=UPI0036A9D9A7